MILPQAQSLNVMPCSKKGYQLLHDGVVALADVEANGMGVDTNYLEKWITRLDKRIAKRTKKLKTTKFWSKWKKEFGSKAKITSGDQIAHLLFEVMGYPVTVRTDSNKPSSDEAHLSTIKSKFVEQYIKLSKDIKMRNTYLEGIRRETVDDLIHPVFNLHIPRTYRSSSDSPNFQNQPNRNPEMGSIIRGNFVPRKGSVIGETDFSGVEVSVSACYHHDENFISYITTPGKDMHRDMAAQICMVEPDQINKSIRHVAKNKYVFPQFYGDFYVSCARSIWESIERDGLILNDGTPLYDHVRASGIKSRGACDPNEKPVKGTFEYHMREVENDFWNNRFGEYGAWKRKWWSDYQKRGYFETLTGFRIFGVLGKNNVINYPVQGSAFHCLLWCLIQANRELKKRKMKTKIIGQIHDSIVADIVAQELEEYMQLINDIMTHRINEWADWLVVPLRVESEITPMNGTWWDKQVIDYQDGTFSTFNKTLGETVTYKSASALLKAMHIRKESHE